MGPASGGLECPGKELGLFLWIVGQCPGETWEAPSGGGREWVGGGRVDREASHVAITVGQRGQEHVDYSDESGNLGRKWIQKEVALEGQGRLCLCAVGAHHRA